MFDTGRTGNDTPNIMCKQEAKKQTNIVMSRLYVLIIRE